MAIPSITMIPSGYKSEKVYSVLPTNGDGDLFFDRNTPATRVNKDGLIEQVGTDVPTLDYSDGSCPSLLSERYSLNLALYSEDFTNTFWATGGTIRTSGFLSPSGELNACLAKGAGSNHMASYGMSIPSLRTYTLSVYLKANTPTTITFKLQELGGDYTNYFQSEITLTTDWVRYEVTGEKAADGNLARILFDGIADEEEFYVWGAQLEEQPYATSYIPTTSETVSRGADSELDSGDLSNYINSTAGVYYTEIKFDYSTERVASTGGLVLGSDNSFPSPQAIEIAMSEAGAFRIGKRDSSFTELVSLPSGVNYKVAVKWDSLNLSVYVNGVEEDTSTISSTNFQYIYHSSGDSSKYIKDLRVYNTALTDAELITLTTI